MIVPNAFPFKTPPDQTGVRSQSVLSQERLDNSASVKKSGQTGLKALRHIHWARLLESKQNYVLQ